MFLLTHTYYYINLLTPPTLWQQISSSPPIIYKWDETRDTNDCDDMGCYRIISLRLLTGAGGKERQCYTYGVLTVHTIYYYCIDMFWTKKKRFTKHENDEKRGIIRETGYRHCVLFFEIFILHGEKNKQANNIQKLFLRMCQKQRMFF